MLYITTRDDSQTFTAHRALTESRAPDGGFYVPFHMPEFSRDEIQCLARKPFGQCVSEVLNLLFGTRLTGWEIDCAVGKSPVRLKSMTNRIIMAETWHNLNWDFGTTAAGLTALLTDGISDILPDWTSIGCRIAILFGIFGKLMRRGLADVDNPIDIAVFSGDFSGPMALWYGRQWGLPIGKIVLCCNENNNPWELLHHGAFRTGTVAYQTMTPEGDYVVPPDLERFVFSCGGAEETGRYLEDCRRGRMYVPSEGTLESMRKDVYPCVVGQSRVASAVPNVYSSHGYLAEPYTALVYCGLMDFRARAGEGRNALVLSERGPGSAPEITAELMGISVEQLKTILK